MTLKLLVVNNEKKCSDRQKWKPGKREKQK
jgi:hypothetical protein